MKQIKLFIPIACITFALLFACENPWMTEVLKEKTITFDSNGGTEVPPQKLYSGDRVKRPANPVKPDFIFSDWYTDNETFEDLYDFNSIPPDSMTLYARWTEATPDDLLIKSVDVYITGPATGSPMSTNATGWSGYDCSQVTWNPSGSGSGSANVFLSDTQYTATVTLTATDEYKFSSSITAQINGNDAKKSNQTQTSITLSYTFNKTD
ncbi:InlB B-repeat-containing protein [Treponema sp. R6D11]